MEVQCHLPISGRTRGATHTLFGPANALELNRLYVLERFAGQGVGTALLRQAEAWGAMEGASILWLTAWIGNARALAFYTRRGLRDLGATAYVFQGEAYENRVFARDLQTRGPARFASP